MNPSHCRLCDARKQVLQWDSLIEIFGPSFEEGGSFLTPLPEIGLYLLAPHLQQMPFVPILYSLPKAFRYLATARSFAVVPLLR